MNSANQEQLNQIETLQQRLEEAEQLIEAIKAGQVDAFAITQRDSHGVYALKDGNYAYRVLIEMFGEGAANLSEEGMIAYANPYLQQLLRAGGKSLLGSAFIEFVHDDSKDIFTGLFKRSLSGQSRGEINLIIDGKVTPVYISLTSLKPNLDTVGIIITDLSDKKRHEKNLADKTMDLINANSKLSDTTNLLNNILESTDHGVLYYVAVREHGEVKDLEIRFANDKAIEQIAFPKDKILGGSYLTIFPNAKEVGAWQRVMHVLETGKKQTHEVTSSSYGNRHYLVHYVPLGDGVTCTYIEITDQKEQARLLEEKNNELIRNNAELASFAYIASHDLQEPLRKIQTFATRIREKETGLTENGKDYFRRMEASAMRMQTLIEDLLSYSRTNTMERRFETADLAGIIRSVHAELREEFQSRKATIEGPDSFEIKVIPFQFRQLLHNLFSNSLKFSSPGRAPHIRITTKNGIGKDLDSGMLVPDKFYHYIKITDNGIGFQQKYNERIFQLFQRLHLKSEYPGTGIGLAIVKKIVENHGGVIQAEGEQNEGASFNIYLPAE